MNRVSAVATALVAVVAAAAAATAGPALAASSPGRHPARPARSLSRAATAAGAARAQAKVIASETNNGKYVTVVRCSGASAPPPITLGSPGTPLTNRGTGSTAGLMAKLSKPSQYKAVYQCTITVEAKVVPDDRSAHRSCELGTGGSSASGSNGGSSSGSGSTSPGSGSSSTGSASAACARKVTLNTGFGGLARKVAGHHPGR